MKINSTSVYSRIFFLGWVMVSSAFGLPNIRKQLSVIMAFISHEQHNYIQNFVKKQMRLNSTFCTYYSLMQAIKETLCRAGLFIVKHKWRNVLSKETQLFFTYSFWFVNLSTTKTRTSGRNIMLLKSLWRWN